MLKELEDRAAGLIEVVTAIGKESEEVYLTMGRLFPAIIAETGRSARLAEDSLAAFSASGAGGGRSVEEIRSFVDEAGAWFRSLHERDEGFLRRINESMERLASLDGLIKGVRADSEDMEIISLNAMTVALKSGFAGKAFSVITDELKRLSTQTISLTESITGKGQVLLEVFSTLRDALGRLDAYQDEFFERLEKSLTGAFELHRGELEEARELFSALVGDARGIKTPVQTIMQEVQHQDIVRQSLEHVVISLSEAEGAVRRSRDEGASEEEETAYIASIARLSSQLLEDVAAKVDASALSFARSVDEVEGKIGGIENRRASFASKAVRLEPVGATEGTARYLALKKGVTTTARKLADQVRALDDSFKGLAVLLSRFRNIVVASRIEIAKNRALTGVSTTVAGMVELTRKIEEDVAGAMGTTKDFTKVAEAAIAEYRVGGSAGSAGRTGLLGAAGLSAAEEGEDSDDARGIGRVLAKVGTDLEFLEGQRGATRRAIVDFALFTPEFLAYIKDARRALEDLRRLSTRLGEARERLLELEREAAGALGGRVDREIHSGRLQEMIQRFTIFTHKRAVAELANFRVEEGAETGEITLF